MAVIGLCVCLFLVWLFALAAYHKFTHLTYYSELLLEYLPTNGSTLLPPAALKRVAAPVLAAMELSVAVLLLVPASRTIALLMAIALLSMYATAMLVQLILGRRQLNCGCAGPASNTRISGVLVVRNIVLVLLAVAALSTGTSVSVSGLTVLVTGCATVFIILLYLCAEQLIGNHQQLAVLKGV